MYFLGRYLIQYNLTNYKINLKILLSLYIDDRLPLGFIDTH